MCAGVWRTGGGGVHRPAARLCQRPRRYGAADGAHRSAGAGRGALLLVSARVLQFEGVARGSCPNQEELKWDLHMLYNGLSNIPSCMRRSRIGIAIDFLLLNSAKCLGSQIIMALGIRSEREARECFQCVLFSIYQSSRDCRFRSGTFTQRKRQTCDTSCLMRRRCRRGFVEYRGDELSCMHALMTGGSARSRVGARGAT